LDPSSSAAGREAECSGNGSSTRPGSTVIVSIAANILFAEQHQRDMETDDRRESMSRAGDARIVRPSGAMRSTSGHRGRDRERNAILARGRAAIRGRVGR